MGDATAVNGLTLGLTLFPPKLASALAKAQRAMKAAEKDRTNPHFGSKYSTLAAVWEAIREPLGANGLAVVQQVSTTETAVCVRTVLVHESGEFVDSDTRLPVPQKTAQAYGGAITYARRYGLSALVGVVADEDDDANEASRAPPKAKGSTPQNASDMTRALAASIAAQRPAVPAPELAMSYGEALSNAPTLNDLRIVWRNAKADGDKMNAAEKEALNTLRERREKELKAVIERKLQAAPSGEVVAVSEVAS